MIKHAVYRIIWVGLVLVLSFSVYAEIDVMFEEDFEDESVLQYADGTANLTSSLPWTPSGSASPDWDNDIFNPSNANIGSFEITGSDPGGAYPNTGNKLHFEIDTAGNPVIFGANFAPSTERYLTVEYDILLIGTPPANPAGEIYYVDGTGGLDGSGTEAIAVQVKFADKSTLSDDTGGDDNRVYRGFGQNNNLYDDSDNITTNPPYTETAVTPLTWSETTWYRVQVVADQDAKTFDLRITDLNSGTSYTETGAPYNDNTAGYIKKVWFGLTATAPDIYVDNIKVYQTVNSVPVSGPNIIVNDADIGPVNTNSALDVDLSDDTDIFSYEYQLNGNSDAGFIEAPTTDGTAGNQLTFTDTNDGTNSDEQTSQAGLVYILNTDWTALAEGAHEVYFRAQDDEDDDGVADNTIYSSEPVAFIKDTSSPSLSLIQPSDSPVSDIQISGSAEDTVGGIAADSVQVTIIEDPTGTPQYWNGTGWQAGDVSLTLTHAAVSGGETLNWSYDTSTLNGNTTNGTVYRIIAEVDDIPGNGAASQLIDVTVTAGVPSIVMNSNVLGPVNINTAANMDVDFFDDIDLTAIEFRINASGAPWDGALTSDGTTAIDVSGGADTAYTGNVFLPDAEFAALAEGSSSVYFRAFDGTNETVAWPFTIKKDTAAPGTATVDTPNKDPFGELTGVSGTVGDAAGGFGLAANSTTFDIQVSGGNYWNPATEAFDQAVPQYLPTSHSATNDGTSVSWVKDTVIPGSADLVDATDYVFTVYATDRAGNTTSNSVTLTYDPDSYVWTGASGTDWDDPGNWDRAVVPPDDGLSEVTIAASAPVDPVLSSSIDIFELITESGASVDLEGQTVNIDTVSNNGRIIAQGGESTTITTWDSDSGVVEYDGSGTYTSLPMGTAYYDLEITGSSTWNLGALLTLSGRNLTLGDDGVDSITIEDGLDASSMTGALNLGGTVAVTGTAGIDFTGKNPSVDYDTTIGGTGSGDIILGNATLADGVTLTLGGGGASDVTAGTVSGTAGLAASNLTIDVADDASNPAVSVSTVGTDIGDVIITQSSGVTFTGNITAAGITITDTRNARSVSFQSNLSLTDFTTVAGGYNISITGISVSVDNGVSMLNTGTLTLGDGGVDSLSFPAGLSATSQSQINLNGSVLSDGNEIDFTGRTIRVGGTSLIDTEQSDDGSAGAITLSTANISATAATYDLELDASTADLASDGGAVSLGAFTDAAGTQQYIRNLDVLSTGGNSNGAFTAGSAVHISGILDLDIGTDAGNNADLTVAGTDIGTLSVTSAYNVDLIEAGGVDLAASDVSGYLDILSTGAITDSGTIAVSGTASFETRAAAGTGVITLNQGGSGSPVNTFGSLTLRTMDGSGTNPVNSSITVYENAAMDLADVSSDGAVDLASSGVITDSGALTIGGSLSFIAGGAVTLDDAAAAAPYNNLIAVAEGSAAGTITIRSDSNGTQLGATAALETSNGAIDVQSDGQLTFGNTVQTTTASGTTVDLSGSSVELSQSVIAANNNTITVTSTTGAITSTSTNTIGSSSAGLLVLTSATGIGADTGADGTPDASWVNTDVGTIRASAGAGNIFIDETNEVQLGDLTDNVAVTDGSIDVVAGGAITFGNTVVTSGTTAGAIRLEGTSLTISQSVQAANNADLTLTANGPGPSPSGDIIRTGGVIGALNSTSLLTLNATGSVGADGGTGYVDQEAGWLNTDVGTIYASVGGNLIVNEVDALQLGGAALADDVAVGGDLAVYTGGTGNITVTNISPTGVVDLNSSGGTTVFEDGFTTTDSNIRIRQAAQLDADIILSTGAGTAGDIRFDGTVEADAAASARKFTLTAGTGSITLNGNIGSTQELGPVEIVSADQTDFNGTVDADSLTQTAGTRTIFTDDVTTSTAAGIDLTATDIRLDGLTVQAGDAAISTDNAIRFNGAVRLDAPVTITRGIGIVVFESTLDSQAPEYNGLTINGAGGEDITFVGALGSAVDGELGVIDISSAITANDATRSELVVQSTVEADSIIVNSGGLTRLSADVTLQDNDAAPATSMNIDADDINMDGLQVSADGAIVLGDTTVDSDLVSLSSGAVTFTGTGDLTIYGRLEGNQNLILQMPSDIQGTVGADGSPATELIGSGTGASIRVNTSGDNVRFRGTVRTTDGITQSNTSGELRFDGNVIIAGGGTATALDADVRLDGLSFDSAGAISFGNADTDTLSLTTGTVTVNTTDDSTYYENITINADVLGGGAPTGGQNLTLDAGQNSGSGATITINADLGRAADRIGTLSITADFIDLFVDNIYTGGNQTYDTEPGTGGGTETTGTRLDMQTAGGVIDANGNNVTFDDLYVINTARAELSLINTLETDRFTFLEGDLNLNGVGTIRTYDDFVVIGPSADFEDPERGVGGEQEWMYPEVTDLLEFTASPAYNPATAAPYSARFHDGTTDGAGLDGIGTIIVDADSNADTDGTGDFYINGVNMSAGSTWTLNLPDNTAADPRINTPWGQPYAIVLQSSVENSLVSSNTIIAANTVTSAASNASPTSGTGVESVTDNGNGNNDEYSYTYTQPTEGNGYAENFSITNYGYDFSRTRVTSVETVRDDLLRVTFSEPILNRSDEISGALGASLIEADPNTLGGAGTTAFTDSFLDGDSTVVGETESTNGFSALQTVYFRLPSTHSWRTDAVGSDNPDAAALDGGVGANGLGGANSTDSDGRNTGNYGQLVPDLGFVKGALFGSSGADLVIADGDTGDVDTTIDDIFAEATDEAGPVLYDIFVGRVDSPAPATETNVDGHNYFRLGYSEPVAFGDTDGDASDEALPGMRHGDGAVANSFMRAQSVSGAAGQYGGEITDNGSGTIVVEGLFSYTNSAYAADSNNYMVKGSRDGTAEIDALRKPAPEQLEIFLGGWFDGSHWVGWFFNALDPYGSDDDSINVFSNSFISDRVGNVLDHMESEAAIRATDNNYDNVQNTLAVMDFAADPAAAIDFWDVSPPGVSAFLANPSGTPPFPNKPNEPITHEIVARDTDANQLLDTVDLFIQDNVYSRAWDYVPGEDNTHNPGVWSPEIQHPDVPSEPGYRTVENTSTAPVPVPRGLRDNTLTYSGTELSAFRIGRKASSITDALALTTLGGESFSDQTTNTLFEPDAPFIVDNGNDAYFGLSFNDASQSWNIRTELIVTYDASQAYATDLAGNLMPSSGYTPGSVFSAALHPDRFVQNPFEDDQGESGKLIAIERTPPEILLALGAVGGNRLYVKFTEPVFGSSDLSTILEAADFTFNGSNSIQSIDIISSNPNLGTAEGIEEAYLNLAQPLTEEMLVGASLSAAAADTIWDKSQNAFIDSAIRRISDVLIGVVEPVWATDGIQQDDTRGSGFSSLRDFDGSGTLDDLDLTFESVINSDTLAHQDLPVQMYYDVDIPESRRSRDEEGNREEFWSPLQIPGLIELPNGEARLGLIIEDTGRFTQHQISAGDEEIYRGVTLEFLYQLGDRMTAQVDDPDDPLSLKPWSLQIGGIEVQRGGVTILNNVINPEIGDQTVVNYEVSRPGMVVANLFTLDGDLVRVLQRGRQGTGTYNISWDGRNNSGDIVARGFYFLRVVGPGIDEIRKVLVVRP